MKCYICNGELNLLGSIPFDKNEGILPCVDTTPIEYHKCSKCNFICSLELLQWSAEKFKEKVYNEDYSKVDTGYGGVRAANNVELIRQICRNRVSHLDYGSGEGHLSDLLVKEGWDSTYYDPYTHPNRPKGKFKLITAIEVFEHSTNIFDTVKDIKSFLDRDGVILFTTRLADETTPIDWWYICARSGHIGILSQESLKIVAQRNNLFVSSADELVHILQPSRNNIKQLTRGYV